MQTYRYAVNGSNLIVDVEDLASYCGAYACVQCGDRMIAKAQGNKRCKHFSHFRPVHE